MNRHMLLGLVVFSLVLMPAVATAQWLSLVPRAAHGGYPQAFMDACLNMNTWTSFQSVSEYLGSFQGDLPQVDDVSLATCFANIRGAGLKFSLEAGAFQPAGCCLGA